MIMKIDKGYFSLFISNTKNCVFEIDFIQETCKVVNITDVYGSGIDISDGKQFLFSHTSLQELYKKRQKYGVTHQTTFFLCNGFLLGFDDLIKAIDARNKIDLIKNLESIEDMLTVLTLLE